MGNPAPRLTQLLADVRARRRELVLVDQVASVYHREGCLRANEQLAEVNVVDARLMGAKGCDECVVAHS